MAHKVTATRMKFSCDKLSWIRKIHCLASGISFAAIATMSSSSNAQTHLDMEHCKRECFHESGIPQSEQQSESHIFLWQRTSSVGKEIFANRQRKILIRDGTRVPHSADHTSASIL